MGTGANVFDRAQALFTVAGVTAVSSNEIFLLVLGLESRSDRNLDEFHMQNGVFYMPGFRKYAAPLLEPLLAFIHEQGYTAELTGKYGYPHDGLNLKQAALRSGIGARGKNTLVLHPEYGTRLRFMGITTNAPLGDYVREIEKEPVFPVCNECSICVDICPVQALQPFSLPCREACLSNSNRMKNIQGKLTFCDRCLLHCPANFTQQRNPLQP